MELFAWSFASEDTTVLANGINEQGGQGRKSRGSSTNTSTWCGWKCVPRCKPLREQRIRWWHQSREQERGQRAKHWQHCLSLAAPVERAEVVRGRRNTGTQTCSRSKWKGPRRGNCGALHRIVHVDCVCLWFCVYVWVWVWVCGCVGVCVGGCGGLGGGVSSLTQPCRGCCKPSLQFCRLNKVSLQAERGTSHLILQCPEIVCHRACRRPPTSHSRDSRVCCR